MKCKICSDVSAKMLLLSPVQNNIVFTYHFFFKNSEKCPKNLIPKMWLLSSQLCKYNGLYFPRGFSLRFPMQWNLKEVRNKIQLRYLSQIYFKYVLHYFYGHWKAKRREKYCSLWCELYGKCSSSQLCEGIFALQRVFCEQISHWCKGASVVALSYLVCYLRWWKLMSIICNYLEL